MSEITDSLSSLKANVQSMETYEVREPAALMETTTHVVKQDNGSESTPRLKRKGGFMVKGESGRKKG